MNDISITYKLYQKTDWFGNGNFTLIGEWEFDTFEETLAAVRGLRRLHQNDQYTVVKETLEKIELPAAI